MRLHNCNHMPGIYNYSGYYEFLLHILVRKNGQNDPFRLLSGTSEAFFAPKNGIELPKNGIKSSEK